MNATEIANAVEQKINAITGPGIHQRWSKMDSNKQSLNYRCELYAGWTLPYVFPPLHLKNDEMQNTFDSLGARAVNSLANKIVMTLFNPFGSFFRLKLTSAMRRELEAAADKRAQKDLQVLLDSKFMQAEQDGMDSLERISYRTAAVDATKKLIVTGNALIYHPPGGKGMAQAYGLRDYCVSRDLDGTMVELITRDRKAFETFAPEVQEQIQKGGQHFVPGMHQEVTVYTYITLEADGKYHVVQSTDQVRLDVHETYPKRLLPWVCLTWNLSRGDDYGRGLVEDYAGSFNALEILSESLTTGGAIAADIKVLIDPASVITPEEWVSRENGGVLLGKKDDVTYSSLDKQNDFAFVQGMIERLERQISQGFLLQQGTTRDAERVTAVEIRRDAQELEMSMGGIYSRLAEEWQRPLARIILDYIEFNIGTEKAIEPVIVTGLDSLARVGKLDNIQMWMGDLAMLNEVPERFQARIHPGKFMQVTATARQVDYLEFSMTEEEVLAEQQAMQQQQKDLIAAQGQADVQTEAAKSAMKEQ